MIDLNALPGIGYDVAAHQRAAGFTEVPSADV